MLNVLTATPLPGPNARRPPPLRPKENHAAPFVDDVVVAKLLLAHIARVRLRDAGQLPLANGAGTPQAQSTPAKQALDDEELALALFAQETAAFEDTRRNAGALKELAWAEEMDRYNHEVAVALAEDRDPPPMPDHLADGWTGPDEWDSPNSPISPVDESSQDEDGASDGAELYGIKANKNAQRLFVPQAIHHYISDDDEDDDIDALTAQWALRNRVVRLRKRLADVDFRTPSPPPSPPSPPTPPPPECCTVCGDDIVETVVRLDCGHTFDVGCIREMFQRASVDEELFPPKCCTGAVALAAAEPHLEPAFLARYHAKAREFSTADRVYCHAAACAAFLGPATPDADEPETLRCAACGAGTCAACKERTHPGVPCHFAAEDAVLDLGKAQGWQRCGACKHLVELSLGCYHIVCRCGHQFCYVCAAPWKQCDCELFYVPPEEPEE